MSSTRKMTPLSNEEMDRRLREYLENAQEERASGNTIRNLRIEVHQLNVVVRQYARENEVLRESQAALLERVEKLEGRFSVHEADRLVDSLRISRHGAKVQTIEQRLEISDDGIDTGQFSIEEIHVELEKAMKAQLDARELEAKKKELAEVREDKLWWKRTRVGWVVGAVAWASTSSLPFIAYAVFRAMRGH